MISSVNYKQSPDNNPIHISSLKSFTLNPTINDKVMNHLQNTIKAAGLLTAAGLACTTTFTTPSAEAGNSSNCENGKYLGDYVIQSKLNNQFIAKANHHKKLKANQSQPPTIDQNGVFAIYDISKLPGARPNSYGLRSVKNPDRWWRVKKNDPKVILDAYQCKSDRSSTSFTIKITGGYHTFRSLKNNQWIKVSGNKKLKAALREFNGQDKALFKILKSTQTANPNPIEPEDPQPAEPEVSLREDCLSFNPRALEVKDRGGRGGWTITQGSRLLFSFGDKKEEAHRSLDLIKAYGFNQSCFVGRPGPSMRYFKKGSAVPKYADAAVQPRDCININNRNLSLRDNGSYWSLTDGRSSLLSSDSKEEMAQAKAIIEKYSLKKQCFVGRPNAPFEFWLR